MNLSTGRRSSFLLVFVSILIFALFVMAAGATIEVTKDDPGISSIQNAVEKAEPGDTLLVESGSYKENVSIEKDLTLKAQETGKVTVSGKEESKPVLMVGPSETSVTIKGFILEDAKGKLCEDVSKGICPDGLLAAGKSSVRIEDSSLESNGKSGIRSIGPAQVTVEDSKVTGNERAGFWVTESAEVKVKNVLISDHGTGIYIDKSAQLVVSDSKILSSSAYGIDLFGKSRITLESSLVKDNGEGGFRFESSSKGVVRGSSITENNGRGVLIQSSAIVSMEENEVKENAVGLTSHTDNLVAFSGNEISGNSVDLVGNLPGNLREKSSPEIEEEITLPNENYPDLQGAVDALEPGGTIYLDGKVAGHAVLDKKINIEASEDRAQITAQGDTVAPVLSLVRGAEVAIQGLKIGDSGGSGAVLGGNAMMSARQASFEENAEEGAGLWNSAELVLERVEVKENDGSGLRLVDSAQLEARGSEISGSGVENVLLVGSAAAEIESTSIASSDENGLQLMDSSRANLKDCELDDNEEDGAALYSSTRIEVTDSDIRKNVNGISVQDSSDLFAENNSFQGNDTGIKVVRPDDFTGEISGKENAFSGNDSDFSGVKQSLEKKLSK